MYTQEATQGSHATLAYLVYRFLLITGLLINFSNTFHIAIITRWVIYHNDE